jgi:hypothetical protein
VTYFYSPKRGSIRTLENYKIPYRCDRGGRVGGDVAIYVKENIYSEEKVELKQNGLESIWMKILKTLNI